MYIPKPFQLTDEQILYQVIQEHGFAILISDDQTAPTATHLPLMISEDRTYLHGHFARANPQWKGLENKKVLAIFQGPHCYISPSWYETNRAVPTWNYVAVHVYGELEFLEEQELHESLNELVAQYEKSDSCYQLDQVDEEFVAGLAKGVVGFRIKINTIEGTAKLSQNHSMERVKRVINELEKSTSENEQQVAQWMRTYNRLD
ncbi:FMN-binding negative transcriptional regulator [Alkalicoccobacillus porphyridii]|uniref:FMN-binding negative transcriptional regulator n=1 Tax=Alkalicoccobacillus porphyridii TaxID=2597270 RepID=A0A554A1W4_9BACI|nr:FMN-binding negative transcriptional regulator [Alkalicoccobacillus porphyridii]TSB47684.1 FMN-binding negative transcriptional regulator [Alkalicoccobacillus porphyridii]